MTEPRIRYNHWLFKIPGMGGWAGIVLYPYILFKDKAHNVSDRLMDHEMVHWMQGESEGWFKFYVKYLWYSLRYSYRANPYEKQARGE